MKAHKGFGDRLAQERREKAARDRRDLLQKDVAAALGTSAVNVSRWEDGDVMPRDEMMEQLAAYFGVTPGWLRYGNEPRRAEAPPLAEMEIAPKPDRPGPPELVGTVIDPNAPEIGGHGMRRLGEIVKMPNPEEAVSRRAGQRRKPR